MVKGWVVARESRPRVHSTTRRQRRPWVVAASEAMTASMIGRHGPSIARGSALRDDAGGLLTPRSSALTLPSQAGGPSGDVGLELPGHSGEDRVGLAPTSRSCIAAASVAADQRGREADVVDDARRRGEPQRRVGRGSARRVGCRRRRTHSSRAPSKRGLPASVRDADRAGSTPGARTGRPRTSRTRPARARDPIISQRQARPGDALRPFDRRMAGGWDAPHGAGQFVPPRPLPAEGRRSSRAVPRRPAFGYLRVVAL